MRAPPQPALQDVLVARPGAVAPGTVARRDDLLAAAVLAAEDAHETRARPRSVLARVSRRWSRLSGALRRRRGRRQPPSTSSSPHMSIPPPLPLTHPSNPAAQSPSPSPSPSPSHPHLHLQQPVPSQVVLHRERELRALPSDPLAPGVDASMRRVRQVGARDDDDTLLFLPRIDPVSLSQPLELHNPRLSPHPVSEAKRVNLPRVSGLMPTRAHTKPAPAALATVSPVSSAASDHLDHHASHDSNLAHHPHNPDHASSASASASASASVSTSSSYVDDAEYCDDDDDDNDDQHSFDGDRDDMWSPISYGRRAFCRLPTGLSNKDVEREIDRAVVEIASDGDSDAEQPSRSVDMSSDDRDSKQIQPTEETTNEQQHEGEKQDQLSDLIHEFEHERERHRDRPVERKIPAPHFVDITKSRALSEAHESRHIEKHDLYMRRANSTIQARRAISDHDDCGETRSLQLDKNQSRTPYDITLFEDDYLSFQGFHGKQSDGRSHQTVASLIRSKRISSVTDSLSEESEEAAILRGTRSVDSRQRRELGGLLTAKIRRKRNASMDGIME